MKDSEVKVIAEAMVKAAEKSGEKIAKGMIKSAETTARSITESAEATAKSITQSTEKIAILTFVQDQRYWHAIAMVSTETYCCWFAPRQSVILRADHRYLLLITVAIGIFVGEVQLYLPGGLHLRALYSKLAKSTLLGT